MPVRPWAVSGGGRCVGRASGNGEVLHKEDDGTRGTESNPTSRPRNLVALANEMFGRRQEAPTGAEGLWKSRYEDAERKRKQLLALAQKGNNELEELQERYRQLKVEHDVTCQQSKEKDEKLDKLKKASTAMYNEYEKLRGQYNVETGAYEKAMEKASSWFKENQDLKRKSMALAQKFMNESPDLSLNMLAEQLEMESSILQENSELEELKKSVKEMSETIGRLQSEVNSARLEEFEAQETATALSGELEESTSLRKVAEAQIKMLKEEIKALRLSKEVAEEKAKREGQRADAALRDRNTIAHQSQMLLTHAMEDDYDGRMALMVYEIESLKKQLEEERIAHERTIKEMEGKLENKTAEAHLEVIEEELKEARCRAEEAERCLSETKEKVKRLECQLGHGEVNENLCSTIPSCAVPPPPPPLPAIPLSQILIPPPPSFASDAEDKKDNALRNKSAPAATPPAPALDDIINQIKGGRFTLRNTGKKKLNYMATLEKDKPPAVKEMLEVLGTLRRKSSSVRKQISEEDNERN